MNEVPESSETEALDYTLNYAPQIPPSPTIPQSARHHALEQESEKYKVELLTETPATKPMLQDTMLWRWNRKLKKMRQNY